MVTLARVRRTVIVLSWALCFFVFASLAETLTSYSGRYTADLERKQMLLESVSEDVYNAETTVKAGTDKPTVAEDMNMSRLKIEKIDLAQILPTAKKFNVASISMSGTLSPQSDRSRSHQDKDSSSN